MLALLAFAIDVLMIRGVLFKYLYVQQRDRPLAAPGLGVWERLLKAHLHWCNVSVDIVAHDFSFSAERVKW